MAYEVIVGPEVAAHSSNTYKMFQHALNHRDGIRTLHGVLAYSVIELLEQAQERIQDRDLRMYGDPSSSIEFLRQLLQMVKDNPNEIIRVYDRIPLDKLSLALHRATTV